MMSMTPIDLFFYIFAALGLLFASRVVTAKNPISAAFSLVLTFFCVASLYVLMQAHFIAAIQILVYAGAVMVLFVFVIMLLSAEQVAGDFGHGVLSKVLAGAATLAFLGTMVWALRGSLVSGQRGLFTTEYIDQLGGNTRVLSEVMFSDYILPFELTSILLLVGIVGSVALAKRAKRSERHS